MNIEKVMLGKVFYRKSWVRCVCVCVCVFLIPWRKDGKCKLNNAGIIKKAVTLKKFELQKFH